MDLETKFLTAFYAVLSGVTSLALLVATTVTDREEGL